MELTDILIIAVIGGAIVWMLRRKPAPRPAQRAFRPRRPTEQELQIARQKKTRRSQLRALSGVLLITGVVVLLGASGVLKHVTLGYIGSGVLLLGGTTLLVLSAKR
jgi:hypothetical protein